MKEQDLIHIIDEKTKDLQIPDSISPDNIKKMLDETLQNGNQSNSHIKENGEESNTSKKRRYIRRFTAAACVVLVAAAALGLSKLGNLGGSKTATDWDEQTMAIADDAYEEAAEEIPDTDGADPSGNDLAWETSFQTPASYEDYFNTVTEAYQKYYDSISTVETNETANYGEGAVSAADTGTDDVAAYAEDASSDTSLNSASTKTQSAEMEVNDLSEGTQKYSKTNTQEKDVDEGDVIKTDGTYIYRLTGTYAEDTWKTLYNLTITKASDGKLTAASTIDLSQLIPDGENVYCSFQEFYLYDNRLFVLYNVEEDKSSTTLATTHIAVYDVTKPAKPKLTETLSQSGWYESSRISDGYLYTISNYTDGSFSNVTKYNEYVPSVNGETIACSDIYYTNDTLMDTSHVVTSLNLEDPTDFTDSKSIPVSGSTVYVSDNSIYFYATVYDDVTKTEILKMDYDKGALTIRNSATVAGYLYGAFAINEYDGYLRIVATIPANNISLLRLYDDVNSGTSESTSNVSEDVNALYVLNDRLELTGKLTGIAPGEVIYSARFMGDTGYFVTYENTDPLFSVDLSDPENPALLGSLEIPGFSNYLHPYGEDMLLGFGEETDADTEESKGLKLSMFDISNPADVTELDKHVIEAGWYSDALYNYKAMMIDTEKNIFGFLYYSDDMTTSGNYGCYYYVTYTYNQSSGFQETARYTINDDSQYETNGVRGLYIGDYLYICTNRQITSYKLNTEQEIDNLKFD